MKVRILNLGFPTSIWHAELLGQTEEKSNCAKDRFYGHCYKIRCINLSSVIALSRSDSVQEYWEQKRKTWWMGLRLITEHHAQTHLHLKKISHSQSTCSIGICLGCWGKTVNLQENPYRYRKMHAKKLHIDNNPSSGQTRNCRVWRWQCYLVSHHASLHGQMFVDTITPIYGRFRQTVATALEADNCVEYLCML